MTAAFTSNFTVTKIRLFALFTPAPSHGFNITNDSFPPSIPRTIEMVTTFMLIRSITTECVRAQLTGDRSELVSRVPWIEEVLSMGGTSMGLACQTLSGESPLPAPTAYF